MAEDMYSDAPQAAASPAAAPEPADKPEGQDDGQTGLLAKSVLGGQDLKPGDECTLEVVADHGDEYEVRYVQKADGGDAGKAEKPEGQPGEMASMLED